MVKPVMPNKLNTCTIPEFKMQLLDAFDVPRKDIDYELVVDGISKPFKGKTKEDGMIVHKVLATSKTATLKYEDPDLARPNGNASKDYKAKIEHVFELNFDGLNNNKKAQAMLANLGYYRYKSFDGNLSSVATKDATYKYQKSTKKRTPKKTRKNDYGWLKADQIAGSGTRTCLYVEYKLVYKKP